MPRLDGDIPVTIPPIEVTTTRGASPEETFTITAGSAKLVVRTGGKRLRFRLRLGKMEFTAPIPKKQWLVEIPY